MITDLIMFLLQPNGLHAVSPSIKSKHRILTGDEESRQSTSSDVATGGDYSSVLKVFSTYRYLEYALVS